MADPKRPASSQPSGGEGDDFLEAEKTEMTMPSASFRQALQSRIATPLGNQLRAAPAARGNDNPRVQPRAELKQPPRGLPLPGQRPPSGPSLPVSTAMGPPLSASVSPMPPGPPPAASSQALATTVTSTPVAAGIHETRVTMTDLPPPMVGNELVRVHRMPRPDQLDARLFMARAPDSAVAASFRVLRHRLVEREGIRVIAVTSPGRNEGKTSVAVNLALALGESGRSRVLLLEANLRNPSLAQVLGFRPPVCFGEQLEFHRTHPLQPWVVVENMSPYLHVAAVSPDAPRRALVDGPAVGIALEQLRAADYHTIVIDCPPVLGSADVNLLTEHVDGVLFAMWVRRSRARMLRKAIDQIGKSKVLGTVLVGG